jgi:L-asparaginase
MVLAQTTGGDRKRIALIALGGTIASTPDEAGKDNRPRFGAADLVAGIPQIEEIADVHPSDTAKMGGFALGAPELVALAAEVRASIAAGDDGIVVTHGTDTIEETAYALSLMVARGTPIVLTGAMRSATDPGADGPANLIAAIRVAATPGVAELGPVVVIQDEVHLARWVTKVHTARVAALASPAFGPIGAVHEGRVHLWGRPAAEDFVGAPPALDRRVELVWAALGSDGLLVDAAAREADGIVIAGMGGGHVGPQLADALGRAVEAGLPVVLASRTGSGPVLQDTYSGIGSERHLLSLGLLPAGTLSPLKARLRLMVALAAGVEPRAAFAHKPARAG